MAHECWRAEGTEKPSKSEQWSVVNGRSLNGVTQIEQIRGGGEGELPVISEGLVISSVVARGEQLAMWWHVQSMGIVLAGITSANEDCVRPFSANCFQQLVCIAY